MKSWTIVLCEGTHDQKAIVALARVCGDWKKPDKGPSKLPEPLRPTFPEPRLLGAASRPTPDYLMKSDRYLVILGLGSIDKVLGQTAVDYLGQHDPDAVGVIVDANDEGVQNRVRRFHDTFGTLFEHAADVKAGATVQGSPRLGLWVAPNNRDNGRIDDVLVQAAKGSKPRLVTAGIKFVEKAEKVEPGAWSDHRSKALLGAIYQVVNPGASLAVSLRDSDCWFDESLLKVEPFRSLLGFLEELSSS